MSQFLEYQPQLQPEPDPQLQNPKVTPDQIQNVTPVEIQPDQFEPIIPDPNQVQSVILVPSGQFQPVTPGPIPTVISDQSDQDQPVTLVEIQPVTPEQIQFLSPDQVQLVTSDQTQPLTPDQFQLVVPDQIQPEIQDQFQPMTIVTPVTLIQPVTFRCDQTISYRDLDYLTAVDVMENENYLEETFDIDEIRLFRRQGFHRNASFLTSKIKRIRRQTDVVKNGIHCCHFICRLPINFIEFLHIIF